MPLLFALALAFAMTASSSDSAALGDSDVHIVDAWHFDARDDVGRAIAGASGAALGALVGGFAIPAAARANLGVDVPTPPIVVLASVGAFALSSSGGALGVLALGGDREDALAVAASVALVSAVGCGAAFAFGWKAFAVRSPSSIDASDPAVIGHNVALVGTAVAAGIVGGAVAGASE